MARKLESDHSDRPGQEKARRGAQEKTAGRVQRTERRNPEYLAPELESDPQPERLEEDDEQKPSTQRDQRRVPRVIAGLEQG